MSNLTTVYLIGSLGQKFGKKWELEVSSVAEAVRAINVNTRGELEKYLTGPARNKHYKIALQKKNNIIDPKEITNRSGNSDIYIIPTIRGNNSGLAKTIIGAVLIVVGVILYAYSAGTSTLLMKVGATLIAAGASLTLGGISQLLSPTPKFQQNSQQQQQSTIFPGNSSAVAQGGCIPVVYGRALVPAVPVSISITNNDVNTTQVNSTNTTPGYTTLPGGGYQYGPWISS